MQIGFIFKLSLTCAVRQIKQAKRQLLDVRYAVYIVCYRIVSNRYELATSSKCY